MWLLHRKTTDQSSSLALAEAKRNLERTRARDPEVREVSRNLRLIRERNHFTERLRPIMLREDPYGD